MLEESIECLCGEPFIVPFEKDKKYKGKVPDKLVFEPLKFGTMMKLQPLLSRLEDLSELVNDDNIECSILSNDIKFLGKQLEIIEKNSDLIIEILCIAYHNTKGEYSQESKDMFMYNLSTKEIYLLLRAIISRLDTKSFTNSTIMIKKSMGLI